MNKTPVDSDQEAILLFHDLAEQRDNYARTDEKAGFTVSSEFRHRFFSLLDALNLRLIDDRDNFFGYFLFQADRDLRFQLDSPTGTTFKNGRYTLYFNPYLFLQLTAEQMESAVKHEVLHILSLHPLRTKDLKKRFSPLAVDLAMDIVVNTYLAPLPSDAVTLAVVNLQYGLSMPLFESLEYYAEEIQCALNKRPKTDAFTDMKSGEAFFSERFNIEHSHDIWEESDDVDEKTLIEFTKKAVDGARKSKPNAYLASLMAALDRAVSDRPWYEYLKKVVRTVTANYKKTTTRRNRRQPERLDLRGELRNKKAAVTIALDISGSIGDTEFRQAMEQVLQIVKTCDHDLTIIECDNEIRRIYHIEDLADLQERFPKRGGTAFAPVIEYCNAHKPDILLFFTDGKGEEKLPVPPKGYPILWLLTGKDGILSLKKPYGKIKKLQSAEPQDAPFDFDAVEKGGFSMANQERSGALHEYIRG